MNSGSIPLIFTLLLSGLGCTIQAMNEKRLPFTYEFIAELTRTYPTPFHIYDEAAIRENARALNQAFDWVEGGFKNYYAVKALPNPHIMKLLHEEDMGFDCSSFIELVLSERVGVTGEEIMFTSNATPLHYYKKALELGAIINLDDISHIPYLAENLEMPELICMRYNPGPLKEGNVIIGKPQEAKFGFTEDQILSGFKLARDYGAKRFGLHAMVASNELDPAYFVETAELLFDLAKKLWKRHHIKLEFINLGGGMGIPYKPEQTALNFQEISDGIRKAYDSAIRGTEVGPIRIVTENGRVITGPYGYLVSRATHLKDTYKRFVGLDANMANLMRPGMYGAYHHISVLGKDDATSRRLYDVTGSLCENNDKFAINRELPEIEVGDLVVIHDTGAHGHSMGFNYNGKLRSAELLYQSDGSVKLIRRAETTEDHLSTLDFSEFG